MKGSDFIKKYPKIAGKIMSSGTLRYEDKPWNDLYNKFDIELYKYDNQDMVYIYGDDGLLELEIVEIENIIDL